MNSIFNIVGAYSSLMTEPEFKSEWFLTTASLFIKAIYALSITNQKQPIYQNLSTPLNRNLTNQSSLESGERERKKNMIHSKRLQQQRKFYSTFNERKSLYNVADYFLCRDPLIFIRTNVPCQIIRSGHVTSMA